MMTDTIYIIFIKDYHNIPVSLYAWTDDKKMLDAFMGYRKSSKLIVKEYEYTKEVLRELANTHNSQKKLTRIHLHDRDGTVELVATFKEEMECCVLEKELFKYLPQSSPLSFALNDEYQTTLNTLRYFDFLDLNNKHIESEKYRINELAVFLHKVGDMLDV